MPELYAENHLIISRAGASSVSEIAAVGITPLLVPLPTAADDHQTANAAEIKAVKGGFVVDQINFTPSTLAVLLNDLLTHPEMLQDMSANVSRTAITDAAARLADMLENKILKQSGRPAGGK